MRRSNKYRKYKKTRRGNYTRKAPLVKTLYAGSASKQASAVITLRQWENDVVNYTTAAANVMSYYQKAFTLNDFDNHAAVTGNFDQYKILRVRRTWYPCFREKNVDGGISQVFLHICNDYDDADVPTTLAEISSRVSYRVKPMMSNGLDSFSWSIKPTPTSEIQGSGANVMLINNNWLNTSSGGGAIIHYGIKYAYECKGAQNGPATADDAIGFRILNEVDIIGRGLTNLA